MGLVHGARRRIACVRTVFVCVLGAHTAFWAGVVCGLRVVQGRRVSRYAAREGVPSTSSRCKVLFVRACACFDFYALWAGPSRSVGAVAVSRTGAAGARARGKWLIRAMI